MTKFKKLLVASLAAIILVFSASICAFAAQIDSLSVIDNTIYAQVDAENARLYAAEHNEGVLNDVFFVDIDENGNVEMPVSEASDYTLYLWDKESLAPISATYTIKGGRAYAEGTSEPVAEYDFSDYTFNQDDDVMLVSAISETEIKGFKAGIETTYTLTDSVTVLGLSDNFKDVVPGSVVLIGTNKLGDCAAIELLATIGIPVSESVFKDSFGVYAASDGSTEYNNIVTLMYSKLGTKITTHNLPDTTRTSYNFTSGSVVCYRVGIAMSGDTPIITYTSSTVSAGSTTTVFAKTSEYNTYLYMRQNTETGKITQCILYCVPKEFNFNPDPDDPYSPIFGLEPIVIIK